MWVLLTLPSVENHRPIRNNLAFSWPASGIEPRAGFIQSQKFQSELACTSKLEEGKKLLLIKHLTRNKQANCAWNFIRFHRIFLFSKPIKSKTFYCAQGETVRVHISLCTRSVSELVGGGKVVFDTNFIIYAFLRASRRSALVWSFSFFFQADAQIKASKIIVTTVLIGRQTSAFDQSHVVFVSLGSGLLWLNVAVNMWTPESE